MFKSISLNVPWYSQFDSAHVERAGPAACFRTCRAMAKAVGVAIPEHTMGRIQIATGVTDKNEIIVDEVRFMRALEYIQASIYHWSEPVCVGVNYKPGGPNRDEITDHFVLFHAIDVSDKSEVTYRALDPGRKEAEKETSWKVEKNSSGSWRLRRVIPQGGALHEISMLVPAAGRPV